MTTPKLLSILLLAVFLSNAVLWAQVIPSKHIYLWDVTGSMQNNGIWEPVKELLIESLDELDNADTEVIIVPFQDDVFEERRIRVGDVSAMEDLKQWVRSYDIPRLTPNHGTNICRALERAADFVNKEYIDRVFLMTDGQHAPENQPWKTRYPPSCLEEYLTSKWCPLATERNAFLVYYHLLGKAGTQIQEVTNRTCNAVTVEPGKGEPEFLHYVSPEVALLSKDEAFLLAPTLSIPVTTTLEPEQYDLCRISGALKGPGFEAPLTVEFTGTTIECSLKITDADRLDRAFPESTEEVVYDLLVTLDMDPVKEMMIVLTADEIPFQFRHFEERWFEIKVMGEE